MTTELNVQAASSQAIELGPTASVAIGKETKPDNLQSSSHGRQGIFNQEVLLFTFALDRTRQ